MFAVARKVRQSVRLKLEGHGRGEAEPEELVNDVFVCLMEALRPSTRHLRSLLRSCTLWHVAACGLSPAPLFYGLSPEQMHRMDAAKRTPRYHRGERTFALRHRQRKTRSNGNPSAASMPSGSAAGQGSAPHHDVLARGRQLFRRRPPPARAIAAVFWTATIGCSAASRPRPDAPSTGRRLAQRWPVVPAALTTAANVSALKALPLSVFVSLVSAQKGRNYGPFMGLVTCASPTECTRRHHVG